MRKRMFQHLFICLLTAAIMGFGANGFAGDTEVGAKFDSFKITGTKIVIGRTLTYGLFKEMLDRKFEYDGSKRDPDKIWDDYFVNTTLLKSKGGLVDTSDYENHFDLEDGEYKLYTEFTNISAPAIMNYVTPASMAIDLLAELNSKEKFIEVVNKVKELNDKAKSVSETLDIVLAPLKLFISDMGLLDEDDPLRTVLDDVWNIKKEVDEILSVIGTTHVEAVNRDETIAMTLAKLFSYDNRCLEIIKTELKEFDYKKVAMKYALKELLKPVSIEKRIDGKTYDTLAINLYRDIDLNGKTIKKNNNMPIDYVVELVLNPENLKIEQSYYVSIAKYFTRSHNTKPIIEKLKSNFSSLRDFGKFMKSIRTYYKKLEVAQIEGIAKYVTDEVIRLLERELQGLAVNLASELVQYIAPGAGQAKAILKVGKAGNTLGKFAYDTFTAPRVVPFKIENGKASLSYFSDLYKYSYLLYPYGINSKDPNNTLADATYESYFLYGTGYEDEFRPYDINNRLATLTASGVTYSYTFNIGAYDDRGKNIKEYVKKEYDAWIDDPVFSVSYQTLKYPDDNINNIPQIFTSPVTGVTNQVPPEPLKFKGGSADQFKTMEFDLNKTEFMPFIDSEEQPSTFTYIEFKDLFTDHLCKMYGSEKNIFGKPAGCNADDPFWNDYENDTGIIHITPGIYKVQNKINILPLSKDEDSVVFGDDHLIFVMANIRKQGESISDILLPRLKQYKLSYDDETSNFFIEIYVTSPPSRDMVFSIYDLTKDYSAEDVGISFVLPKGKSYLKASLPDSLFQQGSNYQLFYHDALTLNYSDHINISDKKLHFDLYKERFQDQTAQKAIRRSIAYLDDFEAEKEKKDLFVKYTDNTYNLFNFSFNETAIKDINSDSPYANEENAFKDSASQILTGQCTWYVYGRVMELVDKGYFDESVGQKMRDTFWNKYGRDAKNWPDLLGGVWTCTNTNPLPMEKRKKGMIAVWKSGSHGHVGFVEEVSDDLTQYRLSDFNRFGQQKYRDSMYHFEGSDDAMGGSYPCFYELASEYENNNGTCTAYPFVDVDPDEWFAEPVFELYKRGIVHGHDGSRYYKPADDMTRAEFIKIVVLAHEKAAGREFTSETCNAPYNDVYSSHWACKYITTAYNKGWIVYDSAHRYFHPDEPVNRAEIAKILVKAHGSAEVFASQAKIFVEYIPGWAFADVTDENNWFYDYVYICKALGVFGGYPQGTLCDGSRTSSINTYFCPAKNINRAEAAKVIYNAFFLNK